MRGDYSLEKFRWSKKEDLGPEAMKRLEQFRDTKKRWRDSVNAHSPGLIGATLDAWKNFREAMRPAQIHYEMFGGKKEHERLEYEYAYTKEGQLELAKQEAEFFNDAFDVRLARLQEALKHHNEN